ncbi:ferredoxin [Actinomadura sp. LD22]|uniref:Ferredoxin n=1 Tax=Actinomadura physcomitrii TaxID=2650748 RepID=A0A6I4MCJ0_9ACTN|nr:ferredoxin [Actinomadura physcomitrii]MVZ99865.1 ferredoxin [Actinomadura physcomitrii]
MKVTVHADRCMGHAMCNAVAPEVYEIDDDGYNVMGTVEIEPDKEALARQGAAACPERAIEVTTD